MSRLTLNPSARTATTLRLNGRAPWLVPAFLLGYILVLVANGHAPGLVQASSTLYLTEGAVDCVHDSGFRVFKPWCHEFGEPLGYPLLTNGPTIVLGALLAWIPGVDVAAASSLAVALFDAVALLGAFALARRLGARDVVALAAAVAFLLSPTILGLGGFPGTLVGFKLLPAYALVDLIVIAAVASGRPRVIGAAAIAYLAVKGGGLFMDGYSFVMANVLSALLWGRWLLQDRPPRRLAFTGIAVFLASNAIAILVYRAYVPVSSYVTPLDFFRSMGLDVLTLVAPTEWQWVPSLIGLESDHAGLWGDGTNSAFNYAGILCVALAGSYLARRPRSGEAVAIAIAGVIAFVLALGPSLKVDDGIALADRISYESYLMPESEATLTFPWQRVYVSLPGAEEMRAAYRWFGMTRMALVMLAALAVERLLRERRTRAVAVILGCLALVELAPNLNHAVSLYRDGADQVADFKAKVVPELRAVTEPGERAFFLNYDGSHNDYLANYLAATADIPSYNAGGDKNVAMSQAEWPAGIQPLAAAQPSADAVVLALGTGRLDVVIAPLFHLRLQVYQWPPSPAERAKAERTFEPLVGDARLRVERRQHLWAIRLADPA